MKKKRTKHTSGKAFEREESGGGEAAVREAEQPQKIGEITVERDLLSRGLGR